MKKHFLLMSAVLSAALLSGCATTGSTGGMGMPVMTGHMRSISIVDSSERIKLDTRVTLSDIIAFAENLTNKMLSTPVISKAKKPPRIVVGNLRQTRTTKIFACRTSRTASRKCC